MPPPLHFMVIIYKAPLKIFLSLREKSRLVIIVILTGGGGGVRRAKLRQVHTHIYTQTEI